MLPQANKHGIELIKMNPALVHRIKSNGEFRAIAIAWQIFTEDFARQPKSFAELLRWLHDSGRDDPRAIAALDRLMRQYERPSVRLMTR